MAGDGNGGGDAAAEAPLALDAAELGGLREVLGSVKIAPLGRNYWERFRDLREAVDGLEEAPGGGVTAEVLADALDEDALDFLRAVSEGLRSVAEDGFRRQGRVEPYATAAADADRIEPYLELLAPHVG
ncbi:MAG TPA: hypothetical protein VKB18_07545 [Gemmatimonadota bacterium]|nr:hypothetical protein [Gemmatimonadota bacterium]